MTGCRRSSNALPTAPSARADLTGAEVDVLAMAAVRATREGTVKQGRETLPVIIGTPLEGETIGDEIFDGQTETAIFPGDLPGRD